MRLPDQRSPLLAPALFTALCALAVEREAHRVMFPPPTPRNHALAGACGIVEQDTPAGPNTRKEARRRPAHIGVDRPGRAVDDQQVNFSR